MNFDGSNTPTPTAQPYSITKTAAKAAPSFVVILLVQAAKAALQAAGITIEESQLYAVALSGMGALTAFINWMKNRKK